LLQFSIAFGFAARIQAIENEPQRAVAPTHSQPESIWTNPVHPLYDSFHEARRTLWSLQPIRRPEIPAVQPSDWCRSELDQLVLARLQQNDLSPQPRADARTLARRLYFDLTGLPPLPEQVSHFEAQATKLGIDIAADQLVDNLLADPALGEHLARYWLDVVRYSDSNGFDWDEFRPHAWRFRDYVVQTLNADLPFDQFIREQLAGDEMFDGPPRELCEQNQLIATGFLRMGPYDNAASLFNEQERRRAELLADLTETTGATFLGLTLSCCRCHDHKYDPLSQADHYRLRAFFSAVTFGDYVSLDLPQRQAEIAAHNEPLDQAIASLSKKIESMQSAEDEPSKQKRDQWQAEINALQQQKWAHTVGLIMVDDARDSSTTHILIGGKHDSLGEVVSPGVPSLFDLRPAEILTPVNQKSTGRRSTLARWIASTEQPLTSRVIVNRVWFWLFAQPLVGTPNDFGSAGSPPADPEILDWMADEFVQHGWSIKYLLRQLIYSATYRQAPHLSAHEHFTLRKPRRLSAEALRDAMLSVSGLLNAKHDGPPVWPDVPESLLKSNPAFLDDNELKVKGWYPSRKSEQYCRSLFLVQKRNTRVPFLEVFDLPDNSTPCGRRDLSTVPAQALTLLNSDLTRDAAIALARRIERDTSQSTEFRIARLFSLALQRTPSVDEHALCDDYLTAHTFVELCRAILNVNEFIYID
jgi:hypothetical protein